MAALFAESITSNLKFTAKVPLLMKATSNDEKPTQGYHLQEISRISRSSLPNCQSLLSFLLGRLEKKEPHIKFKVLHMMKYLVINGHSEFRSQLRRNADAVKQTVNFQGDLDTVHGNGLNVKVQQAASELEKLLFDVDNPDVDIIYKSMLAPSESNTKMQGFGYSGAPEIKKEPLFMNTLMKVKKSSSELFNINKSKTDLPPSEYEQRPVTPPLQYTPIDLEDNEVDDQYDEDDDDMCEGSKIDSDHYYERKLVHNVTAEGGLTRMPSKEMLKDFVNKSSQLDIVVILGILNERLQDISPNIQLKSLCVLEFMLRSNLVDIPHQIHEHCPSIRLLAESQDQTLQAKANKIVLAIASCLKQDKIQPTSKVVVPPSYNAATEISTVKEKSRSETQPEAAKEKDVQSLFSGMSLSTGTRLDSADDRKYVETSQSLIDIEHTNPAENDKKTTEKSNAGLLSSQQTITKATVNQFSHVAISGGQHLDLLGAEEFSTPLQNKDLLLLETCDLKSNPNSRLQDLDPSVLQKPDKTRLVQDTDKEGITFNSTEGKFVEHNNGYNRSTALPGISNSNNFDLLNCQASTLHNTESLLPLDNGGQNGNPAKSLGLDTTPANANGTVQPIPLNPHGHLLAYQPRYQALPGGLVLPTNTNGPRRPFPKDMKSEGAGFDFIRKSTKSDAFSFINDEIQASKTKQK